MELKFGDIRIIIQNTYRLPRAIEVGHECTCEYCTHQADFKLRCSECEYESENFLEGDQDHEYRCPKCKKLLYSEDEIQQLVKMKRFAYDPLHNIKFSSKVYI